MSWGGFPLATNGSGKRPFGAVPARTRDVCDGECSRKEEKFGMLELPLPQVRTRRGPEERRESGVERHGRATFTARKLPACRPLLEKETVGG